MLLRLHGLTILVDPIFSHRSSPVPFVGPRRFPGPAPKAADFPKIDLILITHNHYDHLDRGTIRVLMGQTAHFAAPLGVGAILRKFGVCAGRITELDWWEEFHYRGLVVTAVFSAGRKRPCRQRRVLIRQLQSRQ